MFRCTQKRSRLCPATARTNPDREDIKIEYSHTHPPDHHKKQRMQMQANIREEAATSRMAPSQLLDKHVIGVPKVVLGGLPKTASIYKSIQRQRPAPVDPRTRADFVDVEQRFQQTDLGEQFLQHDSGHEDPNRFLVFSTPTLLTLLAAALTVFCDGTFKISPMAFEQVYVFRISSTTI